MAKLALLGGEKTNPRGHKKYPVLIQADRDAVNRVLDREVFWGIYGPEISGLEEEWRQYIGTKYALSCNSGTAALHMAVAAAGVKPGDQVITASLTFVASALCALYQNAIPVFVDVDPRTFCLDSKKLEAKINEKTKAIIPVDLHGMACDMDEINDIAKKYNIPVIADSCQSHGALYKGRKVGTLAEMSVFSLNGLKNLECGDGGLFNTDHPEYFDKANQIRIFGEVIKKDIPREYNSAEIGWMYRMLEIPAAYARSKLTRLDDDNAVRVRNAEYLTKGIKDLPGLTTPYIPGDRTSVYHYYRIRFDPAKLGLKISPNEFRTRIQKALQSEGAAAGRWQTRPVQKQILFLNKTGYGYGCPWSCPHGEGKTVQYSDEDCMVTQQILNDSITFYDPIYPPNGIELMDRYIAAFKKIWENMDEVLDYKLDPNDPILGSREA
ncbi:MAG: DegT/DnrJ/EryC1/StrS family aminotransferase [Treponema sp.]|jgi:dTDP-4-amino-4,6-dideoxygalactose transaminase|nr:DegT/DnrJ/EryC1/StrS family aminotransferase [Treponema sp.]